MNTGLSKPATNFPKKLIIEETNQQSLISMIKEIMDKSSALSDQLQCVVEEQNECSQTNILNGLNQSVDFEEEMRDFWSKLGTKKHQSNSSNNGNYKTRTSQFQVSNNNQVNQVQTNANNSNSFTSQKASKSSSKSSFSSSSCEFDRLISITTRCISYYNNFLRQKALQLQTIDKTFNLINEDLELVFTQIIKETQKKHKELKEFLEKKYFNILQFRNEQDQGLKKTLEIIRSVHLAKLIKNGKQTSLKQTEKIIQKKKSFFQHSQRKQFQPPNNPLNLNQSPFDQIEQKINPQLSIQLHSYALTLNQFYIQIEQIQKNNFKQMVQQSVSFISNLLSQQIKTLINQGIPSKLPDKKIIKDNPNDFLSEQSKEQEKVKMENFGLIDNQSFTKLFFQSSQNNSENEKNKGFKTIQEVFALLQSAKNMNFSQSSLQNTLKNPYKPEQNKQQNRNSKQVTDNKHPIKKTINIKANHTLLKKQEKQEKKSRSKQKKTPKKQGFIKKQINYKGISSTSAKRRNNIHKQNSLQLIKKISTQQNNRSAKIKSYIVSFQGPFKNQSLKENQINIKQSRIKPLSNSKSPKKNSLTPKKISKSGQKRIMTQYNSVTASNQSKPVITQHYSLKSSRSSAHISEFKIGLGRKQSELIK